MEGNLRFKKGACLFSEFYGSVACYPAKAEEQPSRCIIAVEI